MKHSLIFWKKLLIMTGVVWGFYAALLPIYFFLVFNWGWTQITTWWITGTPVEFILAYPLTRVIVWCEPRVNKMLNTPKEQEK